MKVRIFYLAGDTAVALHLHHRVSRDLDLFSRLPAVPIAPDELAWQRGYFPDSQNS